MAGTSRNPEMVKAIPHLQKMKMEIATELGIPDYDSLDKGNLPARVHGKIGGNMVRRMITEYERLMSEQDANMATASNQVADSQLAQDREGVQQLVNSVKS